MTVMIMISTFNSQDQTVEEINTSTRHITCTLWICMSMWINVCDMAAPCITTQSWGKMEAASRKEAEAVMACVHTGPYGSEQTIATKRFSIKCPVTHKQPGSIRRDPWGTDACSKKGLIFSLDQPNHNIVNCFYGIYPQLVQKHSMYLSFKHDTWVPLPPARHMEVTIL